MRNEDFSEYIFWEREKVEGGCCRVFGGAFGFRGEYKFAAMWLLARP